LLYYRFVNVYIIIICEYITYFLCFIQQTFINVHLEFDNYKLLELINILFLFFMEIFQKNKFHEILKL